MSPLSRQLLSCLSKKGVMFMVYREQAATHFVAACASPDDSMVHSVGLSWQCQRRKVKEKLLVQEKVL